LWGLFPQEITSTILAHTQTNGLTRIFNVKHNDIYVFHSRTTFSPSQTDGLEGGSWEQLSQYTYYASAVDNALWFVTLHTVSIVLVIYSGFLETYEKKYFLLQHIIYCVSMQRSCVER